MPPASCNDGCVGGWEGKLHPFLTSSLVKLRGVNFMLLDVAQSYFANEARVKLFVVLLPDSVVIHGCNYIALGHTRHSPLFSIFYRLDNKQLQECGVYLLRVCS
jgi:hypothetical protein